MTFPGKCQPTESAYSTDILIVGGGLGGVAAALTAAKLGNNVVLIEETNWLGGQLTSQAVPPDEHPWIESSHTCHSYRRLRHGIREYYRRNYPLRPAALADPWLNPGLGDVSGLCHEPRIAELVIAEMLAPYLASGRLRVYRRHSPIAVSTEGDKVESVSIQDLEGRNQIEIAATYVLDATELGDLLELAGVEHVIGAEGRDDTGEPNASEVSDPLDQQAISWCFALDYRTGESHVIDRPASYAYWSRHVPPSWPGPLLSWTDVWPWSLVPRTLPIFSGNREEPHTNDLWNFRRILARSQFEHGFMDSDVTLVNWPQIDYAEFPLLGVDELTRNKAIEDSRELSLSFLYWMQTEAPRSDGGTGYTELRLRPDVTDTDDGLAKHAYIRESRRIQAIFTVLEQHIAVEHRSDTGRATIFPDSVGIGSYRIDLHPSTSGRTYFDSATYPFQIPLGALIPVRVNNLLPAAKNIGTTHITNGAYRLHPVEWSIGEAAAALAAFCIKTNSLPRKVWEHKDELDDYQRLLSSTLNITLVWPEHISRVNQQHIPSDHPSWGATS